jgi:hypothetical protein
MTTARKKDHFEVVWTMKNQGDASRDADTIVDALHELSNIIHTHAVVRFAIYEVGKNPGERRCVLHASKIRGKWIV